VTFEVVSDEKGPGLAVVVPLAEPGTALRVLLRGGQVSYFLARDGELLAAECTEAAVDRGVYLLLAELAEAC
jgi:hypothetical protein